MGDGGSSDAALGTDHRNDASDRLGVGRREQPADRAHHVERLGRREEIIAHAAAHQLAIVHYVINPADHHDPTAGVADFGQRIKPVEYVLAAALRLDDDDIGRRRIRIGLDRGGDAAHLDLQMGLGQAAVLAGGLHRGGGLDRLAECLHRYARRRRDVLADGGRRLVFRRGLKGVCDHLPTSLILPLSASG